jgi:hypothetical protein
MLCWVVAATGVSAGVDVAQVGRCQATLGIHQATQSARSKQWQNYQVTEATTFARSPSLLGYFFITLPLSPVVQISFRV